MLLPYITLSINPSYHCNFRCDFCYLTPEQLGDRQRVDVGVIEQRLDELLPHYRVSHVDLYGGEPTILPEDYVQTLILLLKSRGVREVNVNTNLSAMPSWLNDPDVYVSVSYDFAAREQHERVFNNMLKLQKRFSILMLASPELIKHDPDEIIQTLNLLSNLNSVEVKPYSSNQANQHNVSYREFEEFLKKLITSKVEKKFFLVNEDLIDSALARDKNAFSDDHLYITPQGKFAVLEFDLNDNEFFMELDKVEDYIAWCAKEKYRVKANSFCSQCVYLGHCLSEHLRTVKDIDNSCNGFYHLLQWADRGQP